MQTLDFGAAEDDNITCFTEVHKSEGCSHDCGNCSSKCAKADLLVAQNELSDVRRVIGVVSGKGGVGKSLVTSLLAVDALRDGKRVAVLDADITGPSIPRAFGVHDRAMGMDGGRFILPVTTREGIEMMSLNLLIDDETVKQFWRDVAWGDIDVMFVDMPPGTGDVPLTVFQSLPLDGIIVVTSPQELVGMIVAKAVSMAKMMDIPVLGLVENFSYYECPDCGKRTEIFGKSRVEEVAKKFGIPRTARLPIRPDLASVVDEGMIEHADEKIAALLHGIADPLK